MDIKAYIECELKASYQELSNLFEIPLEKILEWAETPEDLPYIYWKKILGNVSHSIDFIECYERPFSKPLVFDYEYPCTNVKKQILELFKEFNETYSDNRVTNYKTRIDVLQNKISEFLKKPKIAFLGRSDAGKSSIINSLLGEEKMPVDWTPATSIITYIKHIEDKPEYMNDSVWIFKKSAEESIWSESRLNDKEYCENCKIDSGDIDLIKKYGTSQNNTTIDSAVIFLDNPLLKNCDIIDVPGITIGDNYDNKKAIDVIDILDVIVYLSQANGFLSESDIQYIKTILKRRKNRKEILPVLKTIFFVASQVDSLNKNFNEEVVKILDKGSTRLYESIKNDIEFEGISKDEIRKQFFAYSTLISFDEKRKFEESIEILFKNYYFDLNKWIKTNVNIFSDETSKDKILINCFTNSAKTMHKHKSYLKTCKKETIKLGKELLKILKKETCKTVYSVRINVYKGYDQKFAINEAKSNIYVGIKSAVMNCTSVLKSYLEEKYPFIFSNKIQDHLENLLVNISNEISNLKVSKSVSKIPIFFGNVKRKPFTKKELRKRLNPATCRLWNNLLEYILCLYIYSQEPNYDFKKFHCDTRKEIYNCNKKNIMVSEFFAKLIILIEQ